MRKMLPFHCAGLLWLFVACAPAWAVPLVQVGPGAAPVIDGDLSDAAWQTATQLYPFVRVGGECLATTATRALVCYDDAALYVAFRCDEPAISDLVAGCTTRDDALWRDDCIEFMLAPPKQKGYAHIIVNSVGATYEERNDEKGWDPALRVAVAKGADAWTVEVALPWADLDGPPAPDAVWRGNFCRERKAGDGELSSWSRCPEQFGTPNTFGEIVFAQTPARLEVFEASRPVLGANLARVQLVLSEPAELHVTGLDPIALPARPEAPMDVIYPVGLSDQDVAFEARVGDRVVWRESLPVAITPRPQLNSLEQNIASVESLLAALPADSPLRDAAAALLTTATQAADALRTAVQNSLEQKQPLDPKEFSRLNSAVAGQTAALSLAHWPVWTRNNWQNLGRSEMPPAFDSVGRLDVVSLVNEYESRNLVVTNLGVEPLRLRVTASDLAWFPEPSDASVNLVANGGFEADANQDGVPHSWIHGGGNRKAWQLEQDPVRGNVLAIDCAGSSDNLTVRQNLTLEGDREYTLECLAKSDRATPHLKVGLINSGWTWSGFSAAVAGTTDWHRVRRTFRVPASPSHQLVIYAAPGGSGTVWLDDVTLVEGGQASTDFAGTAPHLAIADWQELRGGSVVADPLIPLNPAGRLDVPPGESRQVWLTFPAQDLPPGEYECALRFQPLATAALQGAPPGKTVAVSMNIEPLRLATNADFAVYNWDYAVSEPYVRDLYEHKVNFFLVPSRMPLPEFDAEGNPLGSIDFTALDQKVHLKLPYVRKASGELLFSYGIVRDFDQLVEKRYKWQYLSEPWVKAFSWAYQQWIEHLKGLGLDYSEFCVQVWDEATGNDGRKAIEGGKLLRQLDPNLRLAMDGAQNIDEVKAMNPYIDVWIPVISALDNPRTGPALLECYKSLGKPVYCYTCSTSMKALSAYGYHRLKPWQAARLGLDGVFYWDYSSWRGDPWNDFDGEIADCGAVYDSPTGPITSRRWEASREGIEDWQIMRLLEALGADEARTLIDEALDAVLSHKDQPDLAQEYRERLIAAAVHVAQARPLEILDATGGIEDQNLGVAFTTNRTAAGKLLYRIVGEAEWQTADVPEGTEHRVTVPLPVFAQADWVAVVWDAQGVVATVAKPLE